MCSSEWHSPAATQRIKTSLGLGSSSSSSVTSQSVPVPRNIAALVFTRLLPSERRPGRDATCALLSPALHAGDGLHEAGVGALRLALVIEDGRVPEVRGRAVDELELEDLADAPALASDLEGRAQPRRADGLRLLAAADAQVAELGHVEVEALAAGRAQRLGLGELVDRRDDGVQAADRGVVGATGELARVLRELVRVDREPVGLQRRAVLLRALVALVDAGDVAQELQRRDRAAVVVGGELAEEDLGLRVGGLDRLVAGGVEAAVELRRLARRREP